MTLIKIDRKSIKRNLHAGKTAYVLPCGYDVSGVCYGELPIWLNDHVHVLSQQYQDGRIIETEFSWHGELKSIHLQAAKAAKKPRISIDVKTNHVIMDSIHPEPSHIFEYENPLLRCQDCYRETRLKNIKTGYHFDSDGDEHNHDECPKCGGVDSFEYKFEKISDIL